MCIRDRFVPVVYVRILINIFFINCRQNNRPVVLDSRIIALKMSQHISDSYARRYFELHLPCAHNVFQSCKE